MLGPPGDSLLIEESVYAILCVLGPPGDSLLIEESVYAILCGLGPPGDNGLLDGADWRSLGIVGEIC